MGKVLLKFFVGKLFIVKFVFFRYYGGQKKTLELNPRHPLVKKLKERFDEDSEDETTKDIANMLYETATLRSGFILPDTLSFAERIERMMRLSMDIPLDEPVSRPLN